MDFSILPLIRIPRTAFETGTASETSTASEVNHFIHFEHQVNHFIHLEHPLKLIKVGDDRWGVIDWKRLGVIECKLCRETISTSSGSFLYGCIRCYQDQVDPRPRKVVLNNWRLPGYGYTHSNLYTIDVRHFFFVHTRCAQLKKSFYHPLHPNHPLSCIPQNSHISVLSCDLCDRRLRYGYCYRCKPCKFTVCLMCAIAEIPQNETAIAEIPQNETAIAEIPQNETAAAPLKEEPETKFIHEVKHFIHEHPLKLIDVGDDGGAVIEWKKLGVIVCKLCSEAISTSSRSSLYGCIRCYQDQVDPRRSKLMQVLYPHFDPHNNLIIGAWRCFFVHKRCAQLQKSFISHPLHPFHPLSCISQDEYSVLSCDVCDRRLLYGYCYRCEPCKFSVCLNCAIAKIAQNDPATAAALKEEPLTLHEVKRHFIPQESVTKFIHEEKHFFHEHPLMLIEVGDDGGVVIDWKILGVIECKSCRETISTSSGSSLYGCIRCYKDQVDPWRTKFVQRFDPHNNLITIDVRHCFFVHTTCAQPQKKSSFYHPLHPFHPLSCSITPSEYSALSCDLCDRQLISRYSYRCEPCKFIVCLNCGIEEISKIEASDAAALKEREGSMSKFTHEGHNPQHTLIFHSKPAAFLCNACQTKKEDLFYHCDHCDDFLIHKSCATLTPTVHRPHYHHHPLTLVFTLPEKFYKYKFKCDVCNRRIMQIEWTYHCSSCRYFLHIKCLPNPDQLRPTATQRLGDEEKEENDGDILHFPMSRSFRDPLKLLLHNSESDTSITKYRAGEEKRVEIINHVSHRHPLFLTTDNIASSSSSSTDDLMITVCRCCVRPLSSSPYYSCKHDDGCPFTLHKYCAELPPTLQQHPLHPHHPSLSLVYEVLSDPSCYACGKRCNAFSYKCTRCSYAIDVNCAFLPKIIKHDYFHKQHHLVQHIGPIWVSRCTICEQSFDNQVGYKCNDDKCNFRLDLHCALRSPRSLPHRYCKGGHEVPLMCPPIEDHPDDFYCEICEEEMNPLIPLYYCGKCKNSFHVRCLSRDYEYENWLEEGTVVRRRRHNHPLTYVRRKKPPKEVCFDCNGDINGFLFLSVELETAFTFYVSSVFGNSVLSLLSIFHQVLWFGFKTTTIVYVSCM